jgi:hypothetical protein
MTEVLQDCSESGSVATDKNGTLLSKHQNQISGL